MTHKDTILAAIRGDTPATTPYAPRFDIWFNAHQHRGTLPEEFRDCATPLDVSRRLNVAGHCVIPDYIRPDEPSQMDDRGIGIYHLPQVPYRVTLRGVERTVGRDGGRTTVTYRTPKGAVETAVEYSGEMRGSGATISWIHKHAVTGVDDYGPLTWLFDHAEVEPAYDGVARLADEADGDALVVPNASMPASPMQYVMRDLMDMTRLFLEMADNPGPLSKLVSAIGGYFERFMPVAADAPGDVLMFGANTDETITYPPFYEEHILPWVARFAGMAHERGKAVLIHADGENRGLFDLYRQSGIDVLEAVATAPMTKSDIHEVLALSGSMTVWGGVPSVVLMPEYGGDDFERFMAETLDAVRGRQRFILGVSDTTPPDADFGRIVRIRDLCRGAS